MGRKDSDFFKKHLQHFLIESFLQHTTLFIFFLLYIVNYTWLLHFFEQLRVIVWKLISTVYCNNNVFTDKNALQMLKLTFPRIYYCGAYPAGGTFSNLQEDLKVGKKNQLNKQGKPVNDFNTD